MNGQATSGSLTAILLSDDLIFTSRVTSTGRDVGVTVRVARNADGVLSLSAQAPPGCVIVDLAIAGSKIEELVSALSGLPARPRIVAYGPHVDTAALRAARDAGCDVVLPRSKFVDDLPTALAAWSRRELT